VDEFKDGITIKCGKNNPTSLNSYSLADPKGRTARPPERSGDIEENKHLFYLFDDAAEKQQRIFRMLASLLSASRTSVLYIAGQQGVKGIRLSMKDFGIDVAANEREKKLKIVDSEEWYLTRARQPTFKTNEEIKSEIQRLVGEAKSAGYEYATIISETDMLVRKGFFSEYFRLEKELAEMVSGSSIAFLCAYDERELLAKGLKEARSEISALHSSPLSSD
jgi:hypothetical protein